MDFPAAFFDQTKIIRSSSISASIVQHGSLFHEQIRTKAPLIKSAILSILNKPLTDAWIHQFNFSSRHELSLFLSIKEYKAFLPH